MPLRLVQRPGSRIWYLRGTVRGQGVFESTQTDDPARAEGVRVRREAEIWDHSVHGTRAVVTFATAADSYLTAEARRPGQRALVRRLLLHFRTTRLADITQESLDRAYAVLLRPGASNATRLRNVLSPLRAILEHAARRRWCDRPAFEVPKQVPGRIAYLRPDQATALIHAAAPHLRPLLVYLLATGSRLSEALELDWAQVDLTGLRATTIKTKNGRERAVDLPPVAIAALATLPHRTGRVFRPARRVAKTLRELRLRRGEAPEAAGWTAGEAYADTDRTSGGQIKRAWATACRAAGLPGAWHTWTDAQGRPQRAWQPEHHPHDLRHTWATWRYAIEPDLLRLQHAGGWSTVKQVTAYAHLLPTAYRDAAAAWFAGTDFVQVPKNGASTG